MRVLSRIFLFTFFSCVVFGQADRDFSGRWFLKPEKSEIQGLPESPETIMKIEQQSGTIHEFRVNDANRTSDETHTYNTDGKESRRTVGQIMMSSQTKWEGSALLINTIVSAPRDSYTVSDRWKLSKDGRRLTIERHIVRAQGDAESTLVYEREQNAVVPPKLITTATASTVIAPSVPAEASSTGNPTSRNPSDEPGVRIVPESEQPKPEQVDFLVAQGTKVLLRTINSVSTKHSAPGDRVYLETVYPILSHGHIIIPRGSYVMGSLTEVQQAGRVKGRSSFFLRFDSLTLPNGTTRDFKSRMSSMDGDGRGSLDRKEGTVKGEGGKAADAKRIGTTTVAGTAIGAIAGSAAGNIGMGAGIGAAIGALGGLASVLATRGPDAVLERGSTVEMVLDRDLTFTAKEVNARAF